MNLRAIHIKNKNGFTIVELLIVIVVIAILAAITIVAYNGIQTKANNTARVHNANAAIKLINAYTANYGKYPATSTSCIGNGFYENNTKCWGVDSATPATRGTNINDTELVKIGSLPNNTTPLVRTAAWNALGPVYVYNSSSTVDGVASPAFILYFLEGASQDCGLSNVVRLSAADAYVTYTSSPRYTSNNGNATECRVALNRL